MIESTISSPGPITMPAEGLRREVDRLGRVLREDDLLGVWRVQELRHPGAGAFVSVGRRVREVMKPAMHVGVFLPVRLHQRIEHGLRLLRARRVVEIHQRLAINLQRQRREIAPDRLHVVRRSLDVLLHQTS